MKRLFSAMAIALVSMNSGAATQGSMTFSKTVSGTCGVILTKSNGDFVLDGSETEPSELAMLTFTSSSGTANYQVSSLTNTGDSIGSSVLKLMAKDNSVVSEVTGPVAVNNGESVEFFAAVDSAVTGTGDYEATAVVEVTCQ